MQSPLILVTGASGFLAGHIIDSILESNGTYRVRGTLRNLSKGDSLLARLRPDHAERVEFVEVKSLETADLREALEGVDWIAHCASPFQINVTDVGKDLLQPVVDGTLNLLRQAASVATVKRVAITSSFAAVLDPLHGAALRRGYQHTDKDWNPISWDQAVQFGGKGSFAYTASKALAEKAAWDFVKTSKPAFSIDTFNPPMIYGPLLQSRVHFDHLNTSSAQIYALVCSLKKIPADSMPQFCHARDVADAHVKWLEKSSAPSRRYLLCGGIFTWSMAVKHISERRPDLNSRLPQDRAEEKDVLSDISTIECSPAMTELGMAFRGWQETLDATLDRLLELEQGQGSMKISS